MNLFALFMLFIVAVAAVMGIVLIGAKTGTSPFVDTYGNTAGNATNESQALVGNLTAVGTQVGGGAVILIGGIIALVIILALVYVATRKRY